MVAHTRPPTTTPNTNRTRVMIAPRVEGLAPSPLGGAAPNGWVAGRKSGTLSESSLAGM